MKDYSFLEIKNLPKLPSVKDNIDWTQFCNINDPSGMVMFYIPHNYFHVWRDQGKQEAYQEMKKFLEDQIKSLEKVASIAEILKGFSPEVQREALKTVADTLGCAKPRKPRTKKNKAEAPATETSQAAAA